MSLNAKVTLFSLVVLVSIGVYGSVRVYRHLHPDLPPPPPPRPETTLTIVPGWNVRQVAAYLVKQGFASSTEDVYAVTGQPAVERNRREGPPYPDAMAGLELVSRKEPTVSYEGYLAPETYRVFRSATVQEVVAKLLKEREKEMEEIFPGGKEAAVAPLGEKMANVTVHDVVTMASIIEKETRHDVDRGLVADILWRRYLKGWALQVDSSVHYVVDRTGDVFTTEDERAIETHWVDKQSRFQRCAFMGIIEIRDFDHKGRTFISAGRE
jgi:UPF0755 protein